MARPPKPRRIIVCDDCERRTWAMVRPDEVCDDCADRRQRRAKYTGRRERKRCIQCNRRSKTALCRVCRPPLKEAKR